MRLYLNGEVIEIDEKNLKGHKDPPGPKGVNANDIFTPEEMKELAEYLKSNKSY